MTTTPTTTPNGAMSPFAAKQFDLWTLARSLSESDLIPDRYKRRPENVFLALQIADRMALDVFGVMANLDVIRGTPAFASKFIIGLANMRGPFRGPLRFTFTGKGPTLEATCSATMREDGAVVSRSCSMELAELSGWTKDKKRKDGGTELSKYKTMPEQMLAYRAATFLVRLYCPEVAIMGARTVDEVEDMHASGAIRDAESEVVRQDPLSLELNKPTVEPQAPREVVREGEQVGAAVERGGGPVSPHQAAINAFVALGVGSNVIEAEIADVAEGLADAADPIVINRLKALYRAAKKDGPRALITLLRSERACDMLDLALGAAPITAPAKTATEDLFGAEQAEREDPA